MIVNGVINEYGQQTIKIISERVGGVRKESRLD